MMGLVISCCIDPIGYCIVLCYVLLLCYINLSVVLLCCPWLLCKQCAYYYDRVDLCGINLLPITNSANPCIDACMGDTTLRPQVKPSSLSLCQKKRPREVDTNMTNEWKWSSKVTNAFYHFTVQSYKGLFISYERMQLEI